MADRSTKLGDKLDFTSGLLVKAIFSPRRVDDLKAGATDLIGLSGLFEALWVIEEGPYAGEWAMRMPRNWPPVEAIWVPEGDLIRLEA